jgi:hypothetical protein
VPVTKLLNVGEINRGGGDRIFLKMLRPKNVSTDNLLFPLTMRNIYSLGVSGITRESLELDLMFTEENVDRNRLPGRSTTLLQDLGLDRVDSQGALEPDNQIDFGTGTLDAQNGLIIFPYLEPFGSRIREVLKIHLQRKKTSTVSPTPNFIHNGREMPLRVQKIVFISSAAPPGVARRIILILELHWLKARFGFTQTDRSYRKMWIIRLITHSEASPY